MLKTIFTWAIVGLLLALLILLLINGGGFRAIANTAHSIPSVRQLIVDTLFSSKLGLPGQNDALGSLGLSVDTEGSANYTAPPQSEIGPPTSIQQYGTPSPESGKVSLTDGNAASGDVSEEYMILRASEGNTAPINVSGWSLQSVLSGTRLYIPLSASPFVLGIVNRVSDTLLPPGASATITSGISPIGVSFRETLCTGYLGQMQTFTPGLANSCPGEDRILPYNAENVRRFGANCLDYLETLPTCDFPTALPSTLSPTCRAFLANTFSYNGCVNMFQSAQDFALPSYRLYGGFTRELWGNNHDIIRLLDGQGRTVDAVSY